MHTRKYRQWYQYSDLSERLGLGPVFVATSGLYPIPSQHLDPCRIQSPWPEINHRDVLCGPYCRARSLTCSKVHVCSSRVSDIWNRCNRGGRTCETETYFTPSTSTVRNILISLAAAPLVGDCTRARRQRRDEKTVRVGAKCAEAREDARTPVPATQQP